MAKPIVVNLGYCISCNGVIDTEDHDKAIDLYVCSYCGTPHRAKFIKKERD